MLPLTKAFLIKFGGVNELSKHTEALYKIYSEFDSCIYAVRFIFHETGEWRNADLKREVTLDKKQPFFFIAHPQRWYLQVHIYSECSHHSSALLEKKF